MSIVIVEGVDGSGKTTLLRNLRQQSKTYFWIAASSRRPKTQDELQEAVFWVAQCAYLKLPVLCDRFPLISEPVYGPVMRGENILEQFRTRIQKDFLEVFEGVNRIIYCRPSKDTIRQNLVSSALPQMAGVVEKLGTLIGRYDDIMDSLGDTVPILVYDYVNTRRPLEELFFGKI